MAGIVGVLSFYRQEVALARSNPFAPRSDRRSLLCDWSPPTTFHVANRDKLPPVGAVTPKILINYLLGSEGAIRAVAAGRNGWPLGPLLVLLRAFPRNYDQT